MGAHYLSKTKNLFKRKSQPIMDEADQIKLAQQDHRYFGPLYEKYFEQMYRFVFKRLGGNEEVAGDLVQQTFMKAMAKIGQYEDRGFPFSAWLYRIAQNEVNMFFRSNKTNFTVEISENHVVQLLDEVGETGVSQEEIDQLIEIINNLEESQLDLIELRFFQGMPFSEIAQIYSISEATAKMRVYRILEKIKINWNKRV